VTRGLPIVLGGLGLLGLLVATLPDPKLRPSRTLVLDLAVGELGRSDPEKYWSEIAPNGHPSHSWCGAFLLWVLRKAGLVDWTYDPAGSWFYQLPAVHPTKTKPGDLVFNPKTRHIAMVLRFLPNGGLELINGAGERNRVTTSFIGPEALRGLEMFSIEPLLAA